MKNTIHSDLWDSCVQLLNNDGLSIHPSQIDQLQTYMQLIQQWNRVISLVSHPDLNRLFESHLLDALSLAPCIHQLQTTSLLDIGSGGGFPAVPLSILFPSLKVTMIERSFKKVGFLRKVTGALQLKHVSIVHGEFPNDCIDHQSSAITARAVERPEVLTPAILEYLQPGVTFFCQSGCIESIDTTMFHVEPVHDAWQDHGFRRGTLHLITRR